jgi:hypothetical protein
MHQTNLKTAALLLALLAAGWPVSCPAQEVNDVVGTYCLVGVMEVGSCIKLTRDGRFEYFLAYGAYDEDSEGTWRIEGGQVVLDSPAYNRQAAFAFRRTQPGEGDGFDIIVENKSGRAMRGIDVSVACDGRTRQVGVTGAAGFKIGCSGAPTHVLLGLRMYGVASQTIDVSTQAGADKAYVFEFDTGDLGHKRFAGQRFALDARSGNFRSRPTAIRRSASWTAAPSGMCGSRSRFR